jgi:predicted transcriptional regulator
MQEAAMALTHKTTILLSDERHRQLTKLAEERGRSLDELVRQACEGQYRIVDRHERLAEVKALAAMRLPVGRIEQMLAESRPEPRDLAD